MESELFGHVKGSFTGADKDKTGLFQTAAGGTLFLDEVADLPLHMQVKLLRVIQEKSVRPVGSQVEFPTDVRLLSASHKNLVEEINQQSFRQDLYYRINVIELSVPSLRERSEDIPDIVNQLLIRFASDNNLADTPEIREDALEMLCKYSFPGNVRELENILQRALTLSENKRIVPDNLDLSSKSTSPIPIEETPERASATTVNGQIAFKLGDDFSLEQYLENIEKRAIEQALA